jgi:hypothetical protein
MVKGDVRHWQDNKVKLPTVLPILFVPKAHGRGLPICVDFSGLNKVIIANLYQLPIMTELQDRI